MSFQQNSDANLSSTSTQTITNNPTDLDAAATITTTLDPSSTTGLFNINLLESLLSAGGPVIAILMLISLVAVTVFLLKCWQFYWADISRYKIIHAALTYWRNHKSDDALITLNKTRNPIARVLETAISLKSNHTDDAIAREETMRIAKRELANARSYLKILEVIATLSPLLGLLGTVLGMIEAFQKLQGAGSTIDPAILSGGIWEALLTTAAGLVVAIPTVVALNWLEQLIERFKLVMEDTMTQVFTSAAHPVVNNNDSHKKVLTDKKSVESHIENKTEKTSENLIV
ncbi:MAG: MotA/TolQ/ExbB proton channel family protein [Cellvibrionaceae bacterium]